MVSQNFLTKCAFAFHWYEHRAMYSGIHKVAWTILCAWIINCAQVLYVAVAQHEGTSVGPQNWYHRCTPSMSFGISSSGYYNLIIQSFAIYSAAYMNCYCKLVMLFINYCLMLCIASTNIVVYLVLVCRWFVDIGWLEECIFLPRCQRTMKIS